MTGIRKKVMLFSDTLKGTKEGEEKDFDINDPALTTEIGQEYRDKLDEEIELLDGASAEFDMDLVSRGRTVTGILWFCFNELWCRNFLKAFPFHDYITASEKFGQGAD